MAAIKVLVVGDGPYTAQIPVATEGINFATSPDLTDNTFTISEFIWLLEHNQVPAISVDTAHRRIDSNATFQNFDFSSSVDLTQYDVIWMFGYEGWNYKYYGIPLSQAELQAIAKYMDGGGGVFATGDHAGMGSYMCGLIPRVGTMRKWFGRAKDLPAGYPTTALRYDGTTVTSVNWPGISGDPDPGVGRADTLQQNPADTAAQFQFDDQSDGIPQPLSFPHNVVHPILQGPTGALSRFPDHMHEGEVVTPSSLSAVLTFNGQSFTEYPTLNGFQPKPSVIATGNIVPGHGTKVEGPSCEQNNFRTDLVPTVANTIGIVCAYDGRGAGVGRVVTDSSFHHYLDINLIGDACGTTSDRMQGFGSGFTTPAPGGVLADLQAFYANTVVWLARVSPLVAAGDVAAQAAADGRIEIFVRGADSSVWHLWQTTPNGDWIDQWENLSTYRLAAGAPLVAAGDVAAQQAADGRIEIFVRGADSSLWHLWQTTPNGDWIDQWENLSTYRLAAGAPLVAASDVAAQAAANGRIEIFVRGADSSVWHLWQTTPNGDWIDQWENLSTYRLAADAPLVAAGDVAAQRAADGRIEIFVRGADSSLWHLWQTTPNGDWIDQWENLSTYRLAAGAPLVAASDVAAQAAANGRIEIFVRGADSSVWHLWQTTPNGDWIDQWENLSTYRLAAGAPLVAAGDVAAQRAADGRIEIFVRGADSSVWHLWQTTPNGDWIDQWENLSTYRLAAGAPLVAAGDVAAQRAADGRIEIFVRGADSSLWHLWQTTPNGDWSTWSGQ